VRSIWIVKPNYFFDGTVAISVDPPQRYMDGLSGAYFEKVSLCIGYFGLGSWNPAFDYLVMRVYLRVLQRCGSVSLFTMAPSNADPLSSDKTRVASARYQGLAFVLALGDPHSARVAFYRNGDPLEPDIDDELRHTCPIQRLRSASLNCKVVRLIGLRARNVSSRLR
jgi:hypothetical protein